MWVAWLASSDSSYSNVTNSYATGSVNGHDYTGGLVGDNWL